MKNIFLFLIALFAFQMVNAQGINRLFRFPDIHNNQIVFTYAGDLYTVDKNGGIARKLTNDVGYEMFARFSPNGEKIAFTAQYDGNTEIYLMDAKGKSPKRLTFTATLGRDDVSDRMGPNNIAMCWTPDGENIVYRSRKQTFNAFVGQLFKVKNDGGMSDELPLPTGGFCSYNEDGSKLAYNRVFREFRTWKYYEGGMADDVWIYDFKTKKTINITKNKSQDIFPMWYKNKVYFISDRDRIMNLFVYDIENKEVKKLTNFEEYDIKFPNLGEGQIVFENGGYIYVYDIAKAESMKIDIKISNDNIYSRKKLVDASKMIRNIDVSPNAKRLLLSARGDVFSLPAEEGITYNLTKSSNAHDREAKWSPNGKYIAYISDKTGEYEIYVQKSDLSEDAVQLTKNSEDYKFSIEWSPNSKYILYHNKEMYLNYIDIESKKIVSVTKSKKWEIGDYSWSPDSKWISYSDNDGDGMNKIFIYNLDSKENKAVTKGWYEASQPRFSNDGKYLIYTSARTFNPIYSRTEWNHAYRNMNKIYLIPLSKETNSPFAWQNDVEEIKEESSDTDSEDNTESKDKLNVNIDFENIQDREIALNIEAANYFNINYIDGMIYYNKYKYGEKNSYTLNLYNVKEEKEVKLSDGSSYTLAANGKKMLINQKNNLYIVDLPKSPLKLKEPVDKSNMKTFVNPKEEWAQIYDEAWRQMRDFFYDPNMHGVDWEAVKGKYGEIIPFVNHRNDLNYLIGEMIGELNVGHAYVNGGDRPDLEKVKTGLLGAKISKDKSGFFKINKILAGENFRDGYRSPLTEVGLNINEGDFITSINGVSAKEYQSIYQALLNQANKIVELEINSKASDKDSRKVLVKPIDDESNLYYYNWVQENIRKVNEATNGRVGYIHIPDMGRNGLIEFTKHFYPQLTKDALIIDDRGNQGGNVSPMIIERLRREITRANTARNVEIPSQTPKQMMRGPLVLLVNNYSASDGDLFPYSFKKHNLGKVIGVRTWGGVVGIRGSLPFIDGGELRKPEFASYSADGKEWIIEGYGVDPDIVVDNDPAKEYDGIDQQLNRAIEEIMKELEDYKPLPDPPKYPVKTE